jgi:hypothetical protein
MPQEGAARAGTARGAPKQQLRPQQQAAAKPAAGGVFAPFSRYQQAWARRVAGQRQSRIAAEAGARAGGAPPRRGAAASGDGGAGAGMRQGSGADGRGVRVRLLATDSGSRFSHRLAFSGVAS